MFTYPPAEQQEQCAQDSSFAAARLKLEPRLRGESCELERELSAL